MKIYHFTIGGQRFSACLNLDASNELAAMAGDGEPGENGEPKSLDIKTIFGIAGTAAGLTHTLAILIRAGETLEGRECSVDAKWISARLSPGETPYLQRKVLAILVEAMRVESMEDEDEEVDEVLEEIKKKWTAGSSPSAD